jgi:hypothetical protein
MTFRPTEEKAEMRTHDKANHRGSQRTNSDKYEWLSKSLAEVEETPPTNTQLQLRAIGKRAHDKGGRAKMLATFSRLKKRGIDVGYAWDGIGGWYK